MKFSGMGWKVLDFVVDVFLIMLTWIITDFLMLHVFHAESMWIELRIYVIIYMILFALKELGRRLIQSRNVQKSSCVRGCLLRCVMC